MEPIRNTKTAQLRRLKMYREDLDDFLALFQKDCTNVTISDNKNRYESFDEMKSVVGSKVKDLDIRGERPALHFVLNSVVMAPGSSTPTVFTELKAEEISDEADVLFLRVKEFLVEHQRPYLRWRAAMVTFFAFCSVIFLAAREAHAGHPPLETLIAALIMAGTVGFLFSRNYISLEKKLDSQSFWIRNQERFATNAVTALTSAIVAGIVGWLIGHFVK